MHEIEALVFLLRVDEVRTILDAAQRQQILEHVADVVRWLEEHQDRKCGWQPNWWGDGVGDTVVSTATHQLANKNVLVTSHALEWMSRLPETVAVDEMMVRRGLQYLVEAVNIASSAELDEHYSMYAHAGCAIRDWCPDAWCEVCDCGTSDLGLER
jgi:hypothetical protein